MEQLDGKVAVVTGAASGIGLGLARALGEAGCRLSLADVDAVRLDDAAQHLAAEGFEVIGIPTDVGRLEEVERLAEETLARFGSAHIVVNNAGVIAWNRIDALTVGEWRWVMDVNVWGVIHGVHVFLPILERQGTEGHFVNVSSVGGVLADVPFMATYSTTKAAVIGLSLTLASELRMQGRPIGVTIVCPSGTKNTQAHLAERNRPASLGPLHRQPDAQALLDVVAETLEDGQPLPTMTRRVLDAIRADELWAFPHPDAGPLLLPRLEGLTEVVRRSGSQPLSD